MNKNFDGWNEIKKNLDSSSKKLLFKEREIWWCNLGLNVGDEENGKGEKCTRPVLIIKKFSGKLFVALPLSTAIKDKFYYHKFEFKGKEQSVILSQIRLLDAKRLLSKMGSIPDPDFDKIKEKVKNLIF